MSTTGGITGPVTYAAGTTSRTNNGKAASVSEAYAHAGSGVSGGGKPAGDGNGDRLELSEHGRLLSHAAQLAGKLRDIGDVRPEAIDQARAMIESGELFSSDALRQAARNLMKIIKRA